MLAGKYIFIVVLGVTVGAQLWARPVDLVGSIEEADRYDSTLNSTSVEAAKTSVVVKANRKLQPLAKKPQSTYEKVQGWFQSKRKAWFPTDEEKQLAKMQKEADEKRAERKEKINTLEAALPSYKMEDKGISKEQLNTAKEAVSNLGTKVVTPAVAPDAKLPLNKVGVPVVKAFDKRSKRAAPRVKKRVPLLNVGMPEKIAAGQLVLQSFEPAKISAQKAQALKSPGIYPKKETLAVLEQSQYQPAIEPEDPRKKVKFDSKLVTQEMVAGVQLVLSDDRPVDLKAYDEITANQFKLLAAMILYNKGKCEIVMGLFNELRSVEDIKDSATFHLGACAQKLKFYSTGYHYLSQLIQVEHPDYAEKSLLLLAETLPRDYESEFAKMVLGLKNKGIITKKIEDAVFYRVAKGSYHAGNLKTSKSYAVKVSKRSDFYLDARFLKAVTDYSLGNMAEAEGELIAIRKTLLRQTTEDKNMLSLTAANLARIQFQQGKYAAAVKTFGKVKKNHSLWVTALVEQAWAQVMVGDPAGAIGNMYSLHSPFFKGVYKPESYVVRTIGYLNICQYGDAYKTLSMMEDIYRPWSQKIDVFRAKNKLSKNYYDTVVGYIKSGGKLKEAGGLPFQVIREMARHKPFLNSQKSLNFNFDEIDRYPRVTAKMNKEERRLKLRRASAKKRLAQARRLLKKAKRQKSPSVTTFRGQIKAEKSIITGYDYIISMIDGSKKEYTKVRRSAKKRMDKRQYRLRERAGKALYAQLGEMNTDINRFLTNNEFLRYEVFAGSGQNIRYQVAGGTVGKTQRVPASVKPKKSLNWSFSGEYWEDEIGAYRSSLKNNCPKVGSGPNVRRGKKGDQASLGKEYN